MIKKKIFYSVFFTALLAFMCDANGVKRGLDDPSSPLPAARARTEVPAARAEVPAWVATNSSRFWELLDNVRAGMAPGDTLSLLNSLRRALSDDVEFLAKQRFKVEYRDQVTSGAHNLDLILELNTVVTNNDNNRDLCLNLDHMFDVIRRKLESTDEFDHIDSIADLDGFLIYSWSRDISVVLDDDRDFQDKLEIHNMRDTDPARVLNKLLDLQRNRAARG